MDLESGRKQLVTYIRKYQYFFVILTVGVLLMLVPDKKTEQPVLQSNEMQAQMDLEEELGCIISQISGVGKAEILLTEARGRETIFQIDSGQNASNQDTVILTDGDRSQTGLVKQVLPPVYKGAVVVCKGADSASVRLAVVEAVRRATGLSSDCITVLKMK